MLSFIEQGNLYNQLGIDQNRSPADPLNAALVATWPKPFRCPSDPTDPNTPNAANWSTPAAPTSYKGVAGNNWAWGNFTYTPPIGGNNGLDQGNGIFWRADVKRKLTMQQLSEGDGTSNTFMIGEDMRQFNYHNAWCYSNGSTGTCAIPPNLGTTLIEPPGINVTYTNWPNVYSFRSKHSGGLQFAMGDGSVRFVNDSIDLTVYRYAASWNGGEATNLD
jgi:prepilin-type processing-associated H-X9-DG protein